MTAADHAWVYVDASALLEWLLAQPRAEEVRQVLAGCRRRVASDLTVLECSRALAHSHGSQQAAAHATLRALLPTLDLAPVDLALADLLARPFALEPVRTLDAIHLATALRLRGPAEAVAMLSLDERMRSNAAALGFALVP